MHKQKLHEIICAQCSFVIAVIYRREDGSKQLKLHSDLTLVLKDRDNSQSGTSTVLCPHCGTDVPVRLGWFSRYA